MSQPPTGDQEIITVNIYNHRLNYISYTLRGNVRICCVTLNIWGPSMIRYWYSKHLTWVKTYQFDTYQVNNGSDPGCEEQWAMSWCQAGQDCHYDCILGPGRLWGGLVSDCLFSTLLKYLTRDILHIYKSHIHTSPPLSRHHNTLITDHTSQPFIPAPKVITIFTTNINCMHGIQCLLLSSHFLSNVDSKTQNQCEWVWQLWR